MSSDVLARVCAEIDARLLELHPALAEYERLLEAERALAADGSAPVHGSAPAGDATAAAANRQRKQAEKPKEQPLEPAGAPAPRRAARTAPVARGRRGRRGSTPGAIKRAATGQGHASQHAIVAALEHGSHTLSELVLVTAIAAAELRQGVRHLQQAGTITRTKRDGRAAYALASSSSG